MSSHPFVSCRTTVKILNVTFTTDIFYFLPQLLSIFYCFEPEIFINEYMFVFLNFFLFFKTNYFSLKESMLHIVLGFLLLFIIFNTVFPFDTDFEKLVQPFSSHSSQV